jgi:hypothetical protein
MADIPGKSSLALALLAATMLTPPGPARAAPGDALGGQLRVDTSTSGPPFGPVVAMDADGDFVVAWVAPGEGGGYYGGEDIFVRRFDAAGVAQGPEVLVNSFTTGVQFEPAVAMDADGDFVVAWQSYSYGGQDGSNYGIYAQRFDAAGVAQGSEFRVNTFTLQAQTQPAVAMDADGDFVVAWQSEGYDGSHYGVFARRFNAAGEPQGPEIPVSLSTINSQHLPVVAMDADGDFVVAWQSPEPGGGYGYGPYDVFARRFDAAGTAQGPEVLVNSFTTGRQGPASVAMDADGDFVVVWESQGQDDPSDTSFYGLGIFAQRFDAAGVAQGPEVQVNTATAGAQRIPSVAMDADGDFVVTWQGPLQDAGGYGYGYGVFAQRFDAAGAPEGGETPVGTGGFLGLPGTAMDADGDFVVAWQAPEEGSYGEYGIFAQRFDGVTRLEADFDGDGNADILWRNAGNGANVLWRMEGAEKLAVQSIGPVPTVWQIAGTGDFNGDGKADILWRNGANGATVIWQMDGFAVAATRSVGAVPTVWEVEQVRDINADSRDDILWRNATTGSTIVWLMSGFERLTTASFGGVNSVWQVR